MDAELRTVTARLRREAEASPDQSEQYEKLVATGDLDELAGVLVSPGQPLWTRELAAVRLGVAGDRRACALNTPSPPDERREATR
ncbi:adenylosuccinate lyase, partial [Streptomyces alfalfae]